MAAIKDEIAINTTLTTEVRNLLAGFALLARIAKWVTAIAACAASLIALAKGIITFNDVPR